MHARQRLTRKTIADRRFSRDGRNGPDWRGSPGGRHALHGSTQRVPSARLEGPGVEGADGRQIAEADLVLQC